MTICPRNFQRGRGLSVIEVLNDELGGTQQVRLCFAQDALPHESVQRSAESQHDQRQDR